MLTTTERLELLQQLGTYLLQPDEEWEAAMYRAAANNAWFTIESISLAATNIATQFLQRDKLEAWLAEYQLPATPRKVGIVMAGNIPLVGFHDFLCGFISGHQLAIKLSSKDAILLPYFLRKMANWNPAVLEQVHVAEMLKGCNAYIATGSNNSSRYFEQYFGKYPNIIRRNRTSVAVLDGTETKEELELLASDALSYYGLGCRSTTQVNVPEGYDFTALLDAFKTLEEVINHNKYKNNYDYYLALYLLNRVPYLTNESTLLVENAVPFSAVSVLHYSYYTNKAALTEELATSEDIQAITGHHFLPFGSAQQPTLSEYADGIDTMAFLCSLT